MRVLVACEFSGIVREAFAKRGHDAWSCDLLPTEISGKHYECDVLDVLYDEPWDLVIAHPPCTRLSNSGVMWLDRRDLWLDMKEGALFFKKFLDCPAPRIAVENPIQHKYAREIIGQEYTQIVQPWMFGHPESKATCLWLKNLPVLVETNNVKAEMLALPKSQAQRNHWIPPGPNRGHERSRTFPGIAEAMADQWGSLAMHDPYLTAQDPNAAAKLPK